MKKGRHRRFEEARALKQISLGDRPTSTEPCPECNADPGTDHASWCLAGEDDELASADGDGSADGET